MQKIQSYLYPNRVILIADLAGFTVENTVVYAKTIKFYKGVDNVIQFDIQNADQKRIGLNVTAVPAYTPPISEIRMNVMDAAGYALPNSPYTVTPHATIKGIGVVTVPINDLANLNSQFLTYSVTALDTDNNTVPLYCDSRFSAVGSIEIVGSTMPVTRQPLVLTEFAGEINFMGNVINHTSAIPTKTYEAVPTSTISFDIDTTNFIGSVYLEGTTDMTISVDSFKNATHINTYTTTVATTTTVSFTNVPVGTYNYFRISWMYPDAWAFGGQSTAPYGTVDKVTVTY